MNPNNIPPEGIPLDELLQAVAAREEAAYQLGVQQARAYYEQRMREAGQASASADAAETGYVSSMISKIADFFRCIPRYVSIIRNTVMSPEPEREYTYRNAVYQPTKQTIAAAKNNSNPAARDAARARIETGATITLLRKIIRELIENYVAIQDKISPAARQTIVREIFKRTLYLVHYMGVHHEAIADMIVGLSTAPRFNTSSESANSSASSQNVYNSTDKSVKVLTDIVIQHLNALVSDAEYADLAAEYLLIANPDTGKLPMIRGGADVKAKIAAIEREPARAGVEERCSIQDYSQRITGITSEQKQAYASASGTTRNVRGAVGAIADRSGTEFVMDGLFAVVSMVSDAMLAQVRDRLFSPKMMFPSAINTGRYTAVPNGNATGVGMLVAAPGGPPNEPNRNGAAVVANVPNPRKRGRNNGENGNGNGNGNGNENTGRGAVIPRVVGNENIAGPAARNGNAGAPNGNAVAPNGNAVAPNGNAVAPNGNAAAPNGNAVAPNGNAAAEGGARRRRSHKKTLRKRRSSKKTRVSRRR